MATEMSGKTRTREKLDASGQGLLGIRGQFVARQKSRTFADGIISFSYKSNIAKPK